MSIATSTVADEIEQIRVALMTYPLSDDSAVRPIFESIVRILKALDGQGLAHGER